VEEGGPRWRKGEKINRILKHPTSSQFGWEGSNETVGGEGCKERREMGELEETSDEGYQKLGARRFTDGKGKKGPAKLHDSGAFFDSG